MSASSDFHVLTFMLGGVSDGDAGSNGRAHATASSLDGSMSSFIRDLRVQQGLI